jgi:ATP-dependent helicase/nuclease subunit A
VASDPAVSAWVVANAGTGKTHVLVNRIIRLMLAGTLPERILCLTFTRAAAAEMSQRLLEVLGAWVGLDDKSLAREIAAVTGGHTADLAGARRLFARALETPGGLKVQTIHAFCERLLQRFPVEAGVTPGFRVLDPTAAGTALAAARSAVLTGADGDGEVANQVAAVAVHADLEDLTELVGQLINERGRLGGALASEEAVEETLDRLARFLGLEPGGAGPDLARALAALARDEELAAIAERLSDGAKTDQNTADALRHALAAADAEGRYAVLAGLTLRKDGEPRALSQLFTKAMADLGPRLVALQDGIAALAGRRKAAQVYEASAALVRLARRVIARYEHEKLKAAGYDYDDLIARTLALLQESAGAQWVLYKLDGGLDHILIDEAQDTSREQWEIVKLLADEFFAGEGGRGALRRTIFAVGDKKQSIFSFQGADPRLFDEMRAYFREKAEGAGGRFHVVPLETSFRSIEAILASVDTVFNQEPPPAGVKTEEGEVLAHQPMRVGEPGLVEIWPVERPPAEEEASPRRRPRDPRRRLAERIAKTVDLWLRSGEPLVPGGRPIRASDILILVQRRPVLMPLLVKALKGRGVAVAGPDRLALGDHVAVMDLVSLGRFVLQPADDLALAETLKSPLLSRDDGEPIDDDDLFAIAHGRGRESLWEALRRQAAAGAAYTRAVARLEAWRARAAASTAAAFYHGVLTADGGLRALESRLGSDAVDAVESFLQLAFALPADRSQSLRGFLEEAGGSDQEFRRDMGETADEVRIMTVHGAKGLQSPVVVIADAAAPAGGGNRPGLQLVRDEKGMLPVWRLRKELLPQALTAASASDDERALEEYHRLLYVAMTRARDRLYVAGSIASEDRYEGTWHQLVSAALKGKAKEVTLADGRKVLRMESAGTAAGDVATASPAGPAPPPLPAWARRLPARDGLAAPWVHPSALARLVAPVAEAPAERVSSPLDGDGEWRFRRGELVHRLLERLPEEQPAGRLSAARRFLALAAPEFTEARRDALAAEVMAVLEAPGLEALFGPGSLAEVPLVASIDHPVRGRLMISGRLDRLAVTPAEIVIADFKTSRPVPADPEGADPAHVAQLAAYRAALASLYPGRAVRTLLVWTDGPKVMEIPRQMLDRALSGECSLSRGVARRPA